MVGIQELLIVQWYGIQTLGIFLLVKTDWHIFFLSDVDAIKCKGFFVFYCLMKENFKFVDDWVGHRFSSPYHVVNKQIMSSTNKWLPPLICYASGREKFPDPVWKVWLLACFSLFVFSFFFWGGVGIHSM